MKADSKKKVKGAEPESARMIPDKEMSVEDYKKLKSKGIWFVIDDLPDAVLNYLIGNDESLKTGCMKVLEERGRPAEPKA